MQASASCLGSVTQYSARAFYTGLTAGCYGRRSRLLPSEGFLEHQGVVVQGKCQGSQFSDYVSKLLEYHCRHSHRRRL